MGHDRRQGLDAREAVPVVTGLIRHEDDGIRAVLGRGLQRRVGVLDVARGVQVDLTGRIELADIAVGEQDDLDDLLPGPSHLAHVPR